MTQPGAAHRVDVGALGETMILLVPDGADLDGASTMSLRIAGAESNVLIGLSRLGHRCAYVSSVGDDPFGGIITRTLAAEHIDTSGVITDPAAPTGVFFKDPTPSGARRVYYYRTGSAASRLGSEAHDHLARLRPRVLIVSGLTLGLGGPEGLSGQAMAAIRGSRGAGSAVVFDANVRPGLWDGDLARAHLQELVRHVDVLLAGREELETLVPGRDPQTVAAELCAGGCRAVVVKDGADGAAVVEESRATHVPAVAVEHVVDAVGAGDAFATGIVSGMLRRWPFVRGAQLGAALAAEVITSYGDWEALPAGRSAQDLLVAFEPVKEGSS